MCDGFAHRGTPRLLLSPLLRHPLRSSFFAPFQILAHRFIAAGWCRIAPFVLICEQ
jgi:hypothetical protein